MIVTPKISSELGLAITQLVEPAWCWQVTEPRQTIPEPRATITKQEQEEEPLQGQVSAINMNIGPGAGGDDHKAGAGRGAAPGIGQCDQYEH